MLLLAILCELKPQNSSDLSHTLPSRRTMATYVKDRAILNFKYVGECINAAKAADNSCTTLGTDDTTKAAGHKTLDVKTGHITIIQKKGETTKHKHNRLLGEHLTQWNI